jgi:hypothetical protein
MTNEVAETSTSHGSQQAVGSPLERSVRPQAWQARLVAANYAGPTERSDRCGTCKHAKPYPHGRRGRLKCRRVGWYVQTGGICDEHAERERVRMLESAEEGAREAFAHVVDRKNDAETECEKLRGLLSAAYADIRRLRGVA